MHYALPSLHARTNSFCIEEEVLNENNFGKEKSFNTHTHLKAKKVLTLKLNTYLYTAPNLILT